MNNRTKTTITFVSSIAILAILIAIIPVPTPVITNEPLSYIIGVLLIGGIGMRIVNIINAYRTKKE